MRGVSQVRKLFEQARDNFPSIVFFDDIDAVFQNHDEVPACTTQVSGWTFDLLKLNAYEVLRQKISQDNNNSSS